MINAIVGRPRSGKSYEAVRYHIIPAVLQDKRLVVTNIPVNLEYIKRVHGQESADLIIVVDGAFSDYGNVRPFAHEQDYLEHDQWKNEKGQGALFVVDEMHLSAGRNARPALLEYFSMHGHYGHDLICLTQNARKLNRDLKDMIEIVWRTTKMSAYGKDDSYLQKTHHGIENIRDAIATEERNYDPEWFPYYQSHTQSKGSVVEAVAEQVRAKVDPYSRLSKVLLTVGGIGFLYTLYAVFSGNPEPEKTAVIEVEQAQSPKPVTALEAFKNQAETVLPDSIAKEPAKLETMEDRNKIELNKIKAKSRKYHPFNKVQLHIDGYYSDAASSESRIFFSASSNGQRLFKLELKDFFLAGYDVQVFSDCIVKITYYEFQDFLICDVPTVGVGSLKLASN